MTVFSRGNATLAYLMLILLLGGASAAGFMGNLVLQIGACGLIAWALLSAPRPDAGPFPRLFVIAAAVLVAVQFLPLPPGLWRHLPGRDTVAAGFTLLGVAPPWLTVSLAPWSTLSSLLWWLPALAIYLSLRREGAPSSRLVIYAVTAVAVVSTAIEALQRGVGSAYFYAITNYGEGTGFFANSNHQGSFLLATLALFTSNLVAKHKRNRHRIAWYRQSSPIELAIVLLLVAGVMISGSLACAGLLVLVLASLALIGFPEFRLPTWAVVATAAIVAIGFVTFVFFVPIANDLTSTGSTPGISRREFLTNGLVMLRDFKVFGSGIGTFASIYPWYEQPGKIGTTFVNHAHDDLLELLIETGLFGLLAVAAFVGWFLRASLPLWRAPRERSIQLGAAVAIGMVLLHSLVDYPLRTAAMSTVVALACALLTRKSDEGGSAVPTHRPQRRGDRQPEDLIRI